MIRLITNVLHYTQCTLGEYRDLRQIELRMGVTFSYGRWVA